MYTDKNHIRVSDPGQVEDNVVFKFLDVFLEDTARLEELKTHYRKGGLGDSYLKDILLLEIERVVAPIRDKYYDVSDKVLLEYLMAGTERAKIKAKEKIKEVKSAVSR